jgi:hypothetical protein
MPDSDTPPVNDLVTAALRYCAVADWFERRPRAWQKHLGEANALHLFNAVEAQLRIAGEKALRAHGVRERTLIDAGVPAEAAK